jgi:hypothetical protein
MNYLAASCRGIKIDFFLFLMQASEYHPALTASHRLVNRQAGGWQDELIYPDTLRYRDYSLRS